MVYQIAQACRVGVSTLCDVHTVMRSPKDAFPECIPVINWHLTDDKSQYHKNIGFRMGKDVENKKVIIKKSQRKKVTDWST